MRRITRTIPTTTINYAVISFTNGQMEITDCQPLVIAGKRIEKDEQAMTAIRKANPAAVNLVIKSLDYSEDTYACSVADFLSVATKLDKAEAATEEAAADTAEEA